MGNNLRSGTIYYSSTSMVNFFTYAILFPILWCWQSPLRICQTKYPSIYMVAWPKFSYYIKRLLQEGFTFAPFYQMKISRSYFLSKVTGLKMHNFHYDDVREKINLILIIFFFHFFICHCPFSICAADAVNRISILPANLS